MTKAIHWFRNDLRLHDQPMLRQLEHSSDTTLLPAFCFDERWFVKDPLGFPKTGAWRTKFLIETINDVQSHLRHRGSDLFIAYGKPEEVISKLANDFNADVVYAQKEDTREETCIEHDLKSRLQIPVHFLDSRTLLGTDQLPFSIDTLPDMFTNFKKRIEPILHRVRIVDAPETLPPFPGEFRSNQTFSLKDFGLDEPVYDTRAVMQFIGGETEGLNRLNKFIRVEKSILHYKETRNQLIGESYSSKLSPWLANGSLSARMILNEIKEFEKAIEANISTYWLTFELLWREYFRFVTKKHGNNIFHKGGIRNMQTEYCDDHSLFEQWRIGKTGNDFVDANMIELLKTGFMSNRGRQNVASYLCKELKIDWRWGARWFESQLIDYDVASNWCNWMYIAGVGNDPRPNRYFDVNKQAVMYDGDGSYRKLWLS